MAKKGKLARVIAVTNEKGGVGKTTIVVNLGVALARDGYKVLLVDMDNQGHILGTLHRDTAIRQWTVADFLLDENRYEDVVVHYSENLHVLPSNENLREVENSLNMDDPEVAVSILKIRLVDVRPLYDFVLIDCPPNIGFLTMNALVASTDIFIPTKMAFTSYNGCLRIITTVTDVVKRYNSDTVIRGIIPNMVNTNTIVSRAMAKLYNGKLHEFMLPEQIRVDTKIEESVVIGQGVIEYKPRSGGSLDFMKLKDKVIKICK